MDSISESFSHNLKRRRRELHLTQKELGERLGYTEKAVSKWERGVSLPPFEAVLRLSDALETDINALLDYRQPPAYFLGIDGGATKTQFLLTDAHGNPVNSVRLGACNPVNLGMPATLELLGRGIREVCRGIPLGRVSVFAGVAGGITGNNKAMIGDFLRSFRFACVGNGSDAENVVAAGLGNADGIAVILGTGIIAFAKQDGVSHRVAGFGPLFDEGGSGYHFGRDVLRACLLEWEGSGRKTLLTGMAEDKLGCPVIDALGDLYAKDRGFIASFAPMVFEACDRQDAVAQEILSRNMRCAATVIESAGRYLPTDDRVRVVLYGGLTARADLLIPCMSACLSDPDRYDLTVCREEPAVGALLLAGLPAATNGAVTKNNE